jgi:hypothetical protein
MRRQVQCRPSRKSGLQIFARFCYTENASLAVYRPGWLMSIVHNCICRWLVVVLPVALLMSATAAASSCKTTRCVRDSVADRSGLSSAAISSGSPQSSEFDRLAPAGRRLGPATDRAFVGADATRPVYRPRAGATTTAMTGCRVHGNGRVPAPPALRTTPRSAFRITGLHGGSIPCGAARFRNSLFRLPDEDDDTTSREPADDDDCWNELTADDDSPAPVVGCFQQALRYLIAPESSPAGPPTADLPSPFLSSQRLRC